jgi:hypothetical protein
MTLQRGDLLPPGRYWQDFFGPKIDIATAWLAAQSAAKRVKVVATEGTNDAQGTWILFEVSEQMPWPELELGSPTVAVPSVRTRQDTVQRPPPEPDLADQLHAPAQGTVLAAVLVAAALIIATMLLLNAANNKGK